MMIILLLLLLKRYLKSNSSPLGKEDVRKVFQGGNCPQRKIDKYFAGACKEFAEFMGNHPIM